MNKKIKTVLAATASFFGGMYVFSTMQMWLCNEGRMYIYLKDGVGNVHEYGKRKIVPPTSGRYHWNSDSKKEEEVPE